MDAKGFSSLPSAPLAFGRQATHSSHISLHDPTQPRVRSGFRVALPLATLIAAVLAATPALAIDYYWDIDGATPGAGGPTPSGSWATGGTTWSTDPAGATATSAVTTTSIDDLFFSAGSDATGSYTVTLGANQNARRLTFKNGTVTLTANTITLGGGGGITVNAASGNPTISSGLTINGGNVFNVGTGRTLTLSTGTFTRGTLATLNIQGAGTVTSTMTGLANNTNRIVGPWASFGTGGSTTYAAFSGTSLVGLTYAASPSASQGTSVTASTGVVTGAGSLNYSLNAAGTLGASANINTLRYTGGAGTLATSTSFTTLGIMNAGTGLLTFSGAVTAGASATEMVVDTANNNIQFDGILTGTITKTGSGTMTLGGTVNHALGAWTVNEGTLQLNGTATGDALPGGTVNSGGTVRLGGGNTRVNNSAIFTVNAGGIFDLNGITDQIGQVEGAGSITNTSATAASLNLNATASRTFSGVIGGGSGVTSLIINGNGGTQTLSGLNTYTGTTQVRQGTLSINSIGDVSGGASAIGAPTTIANGLIQIGQSGTIGTLIYTGGVQSTNRTIQIGANSTTPANTDTGGATITNNGSGPLTFSAATFNTQTNAATGAGANRTLTLQGSNGGTISGIIRNNLVSGTATGTATVALTKAGSGTWTLSGANTYTGATTISGGTLRLANTSALATTSGIAMNTASNSLAFATDAAFTTLPSISASSGAFTYTLVSDRATAGAGLTHALSTGSFGNATYAFTAGSNVTSGTAGISLTGITLSGGAAGTATLAPGAGASVSIGTVAGNSSAKTLALEGNGTGSITGSIANGSAAVTLSKAGSGTWTLSGLSGTAASNYSGTTTINQGTLAITSTSPSLTGGLTFGSSAGSTNIGTLDLSTTAGATFGGALLVQTDSASANTITIGSGRTLQINGSVTLGYNSAATSNTRLTATGAGTLSIGASGAATNANVQIGNGATTNISNIAAMDLSGLATFNAYLGTGTFRIGNNTNSNGTGQGGSSVILATNSTIQATSLLLASADGSGVTQLLRLGSGTGATNVLNVNTITVVGSGRSNGTVSFNAANGSVTVRGLNGGDTRAELNVGVNPFGTGTSTTGTFDTTGTGHTADLRFGTMTIGSRGTGSGTGTVTGNFIFDAGTLDANDLRAGLYIVGGNSTGNVNLNGGTATFNASTSAITLGDNTAATGTGIGTGNLNISGTASVTVAANAGSSFILGNATTAGGTATGLVNLTGGTLTVAGDIIRGAMTGTSNATVTLNGAAAILDMGGHDIGTLAAPVTFNAQVGELRNVATINGTAGLTKSTAGTLTLSGTNGYTGDTTISSGTLRLGSVDAIPSGSGKGNVAVTGTLDLNTFSEAINGLSGAGTVDTVAGGTPTLTVGADNATSTFTGVIRNTAGSLGLTKTGTGTLTLSGDNSYGGATLVSGGAIAVSGAGDINGSSDITINGSGAKLLQTSSVALTPTITLTQGTLTGSGTVGDVTVGAGTGGLITNNDGLAGAALTLGSLALGGAADLNLFSNGASTSSTLIVTGSLTTGGTAATLTANNAGGWTNGSTYTILTFGGGSIAGSGDNFTKVINNLATRQTSTWGLTGSAVTLAISGDNPVWSGASGGNWTTAPTGDNTGPNNWALSTGNTGTNFWAGDNAQFNDTYDIGGGPVAVTQTTVDISAANVSPNLTTFNNVSVGYILSSSGGFGIASGSLTKSGTGSLSITNANTYGGGTILDAGTLVLGNTNAIGTGTVTINGGNLDSSVPNLVNAGNNPQIWNASFSFAGTNDLNLGTGAVTLANTPVVTVSAGTLTVGGSVGGSAGWTKGGAGALLLSAASNYLGTTTLTTGTLVLGNAGALSTGALTINGGSLDSSVANLVNSGNNAQAWNGDFTFVGTQNLNLGTGAVTLGSTRQVTVNAGTLTVGGVIGGTGFGLAKAGPGILALTGGNTYTGNTSINAGTLELGGTAGALTGTTGITSAGTGTLFINRSNAFTQATELAGAAITGAGLSVAKSGAGTTTLSVANSYGGGTTLSGGILTAANNSALGSGTLTIGSNAIRFVVNDGITIGNNITIDASAGFGGRGLIEISSTTGNATLSGGTITINGGITAGGTFASQGTSTLTVANVINSASTPVSLRTGTGIFSGGGSYSSFLITGTARLGANNGLSTSATVEIGASATGTFDLAGFNQTLVGITKLSANTGSIGNSSTTADSTLTTTGTSSYAGTIVDVVGSGTRKVALAVNGGTLTLTGNNTFTGGISVTASGTLTATKNAATTNALSTGAVSIAANANLVVDVVKTTNIADSIDNVFTGSGMLKLQFAANTTARNTSMPNVTGFNGAIQLSSLGTTGDKWNAANVGTVAGSLTIDSGNTIAVNGGPASFTGGITLNGTGNSEDRGAIRMFGTSATLGGTISLASSSTINMEAGTHQITGNIGSSATGTTLTLGATGSVGGTLSGAIGDGTGTLTVTNAAGSYTLSGNLSHTGGVNVIGGLLTLSGASNTYAGITAISPTNGRSLLVTTNAALGATGTGNETTVGAAGQLGLSGGITYSAREKIIGSGAGNSTTQSVFASGSRGFIQSVSGNNTFAGDIELSADGTSRIGTQNGAQLTLTGAITQGTGVTTASIMFRTGDNAGDFVTLSNAGNSFGGDSTVYNNLAAAGQYAGLRIGVDNAHPTNLTVVNFPSSSGSSTSLDLNGKQQTLNGLANGGVGTLNIINLDTANASTLTLSPTANKTNAATMTILGGSPGGTPLGIINVVKSGSAVQTLVGNHTYTGTTTVSAGALEIASTGSINATSGITVAAGGLLAYNSSTALTAPTTLGGTGTGAGQRAVLGGTGTINLALALDNTGDVLSPGNSPGIMPFATTQVWSSFGYDWELNDWTASVAGTNIDQIQITGGLTLTGATAGSYVVDVLSLTAGNVAGNVANFADATNSWTILTTTGGITGFDAGRWTVDASGFTSTPAATGTWSVGLSNDSQNLVLNYVPVPEPSTLALAALGLAALGCRLHRRRVTRGSQA